MPRGCLQFVIVVFSDHTHLLFLDDKSLLIISDLAALILKKKKQPEKVLVILGESGMFPPQVQLPPRHFAPVRFAPKNLASLCLHLYFVCVSDIGPGE